MDFFSRVFGGRETTASRHLAKERLRMVLVQDRASVAPQIMDMLKEDITEAISRYMDVDEKAMEIALNRGDSAMALVASVPIVRMKRGIARGG